MNDALVVKIGDGLTVAVPPQLSVITTYVLLEQEQWFEKEIDFVRSFLKPGMTAIDVGANLGVYTLLMARLVGVDGQVFAYEPGAEARAFLELSRTLNNLANIEIFGSALSDDERNGYLGFAASSELRALDASGDGEPVHVTSLDMEDALRRWKTPDFIKIDAEGEEERIIAGGRNFFSAHSPLVMFEVKAGDNFNLRLLTIFEGMGYRLFRQLAGAPVLVPKNGTHIESFELNLFAAKPDRVTELVRGGLLVEGVVDWVPAESDRRTALEFWQSQEFTSLYFRANGDLPNSDDYQDAIVAYAVWRDASQPMPKRCAALALALRRLRVVCANGSTPTRESTWARVAWEWGERSEAVSVLQRLLPIVHGQPIHITEPFLPACPRFDYLYSTGEKGDWFFAAALEQFERLVAFSSTFSGGFNLELLCTLPFVSSEMKRRLALTSARNGGGMVVPDSLCAPAHDNLNADFWSSRRALAP